LAYAASRAQKKTLSFFTPRVNSHIYDRNSFFEESMYVLYLLVKILLKPKGRDKEG
jgi:hypothetical protein